MPRPGRREEEQEQREGMEGGIKNRCLPPSSSEHGIKMSRVHRLAARKQRGRKRRRGKRRGLLGGVTGGRRGAAIKENVDFSRMC